MSRPRVRQAVVVIHGVGEQRPMDTLRRFVDAVLGTGTRGIPNYVSRPDHLSRLLELRTLQDRVDSEFSKTHFFECYWAHKMVGTKWRHVTEWVRSILLRRPGDVPAHLKGFWRLAWVFALLALLAVAGGVVGQVRELAELRWWGGAFVLLLGVVGGLFGVFVLRFVGDAARYLSPLPHNIAIRQSIRADALQLLRKLHERGDYDRIVVVGHSLGSVVAYDVLQYLWSEYHNVYRTPRKHEQKALKRVESLGGALSARPDEASLREYRKAQAEAWWELRELGCPWLVTDFITAGSPLAHAAFLIARNAAEFKTKKEHQELPENPPYPDMNVIRDGGWLFSYEKSYPLGDGGSVKLRALHHGAMFACVRWTNMYFPVRWVLSGDPIAGEVSSWFGSGVKDVPVTDHRWLIRRTPAAHTNYWCSRGADGKDSTKATSEGAGSAGGGDPEALRYTIPAVLDALDLDCRNTFPAGDLDDERLDAVRRAATP